MEAHGAQLDEAPIETPGAIQTVERYHGPLMLAYERISTEARAGTTNQECLNLVVFEINCTVGPERLCPGFLDFGALPRSVRTTPAATQ